MEEVVSPRADRCLCPVTDGVHLKLRLVRRGCVTIGLIKHNMHDDGYIIDLGVREFGNIVCRNNVKYL